MASIKHLSPNLSYKYTYPIFFFLYPLFACYLGAHFHANVTFPRAFFRAFPAAVARDTEGCRNQARNYFTAHMFLPRVLGKCWCAFSISCHGGSQGNAKEGKGGAGVLMVCTKLCVGRYLLFALFTLKTLRRMVRRN